MEISDGQFEQIIGLLAENRIAITTLKNDLSLEIVSIRDQLSQSLRLLSSRTDAIEDDLTELQATARVQENVLLRVEQSLDGVTQLCKSSFDLAESIMNHLAEMAPRSHRETQEAPPTPRQ